MRRIIDGAILAVGHPGNTALIHQVGCLIAMSSAVVFASLAISKHSEYLEYKLSKVMGYGLHRRTLAHCIHADFEVMESPAYQDMLNNAQEHTVTSLISIHSSFLSIIRRVCMISYSFIVLYAFEPLLSFLIILSVLPCLFLGYKLSLKHNEFIRSHTSPQRHANYCYSMIMSRYFAKEIMILGIGLRLLERWEKLRLRYLAENIGLKKRECLYEIFVYVIRQTLYGILYFYIALRTVRDGGSVGSMIMNVGLVFNVQGYMQEISNYFIDLYKHSISVGEYNRNIAIEPRIENARSARNIEEKISSVVFEGSFLKFVGAQPLRGEAGPRLPPES